MSCPATRDGWYCTRQRGHRGEHQARGENGVKLHAWRTRPRPQPTDQRCTCVWDEPGALQWRNPDCPQHGRPQSTDQGDRS